MKYEVEQKFPVADLEALADRLRDLGATMAEPSEEVDRYFAHPSRDFAATDEALRLRSVAEENRITYKGPKTDKTTKTRREIELPLHSGSEQLAEWSDLLEALGFSRVAEVRKRRSKATVIWEGRQVEAALDEVDRVGSYVELELSAENGGVEEAKACLASLASELGLSQSQTKSYLELLLEKRHHGS